ncbi:transmembrane protein, putative (macronuclear) [Tetrahymena thermophila SB210]|uniref:Transmembrane protein, putative n=1 Tax=Tetrahymena thermophila (strain SB210) TaxID=312017 RepID=Q22NK8_TETTS|nr:transmembrane protein, putative [Tetrahymena thermophila SB210]EAR86777.2 transmembrane protein, putative [Tetrahymena thermophila SB210]|eukprot:XP_001007022.2 transmembrane protein, putative [Tetrahymena thermophila SB210]
MTPTTKSDVTIATYANGNTSCVQATNGSLLALSSFFLAILALVFQFLNKITTAYNKLFGKYLNLYIGYVFTFN